jgi:predicted PurR-regulated permease PerM
VDRGTSPVTATGAPTHPRLRPPTYRTLVLIAVVVLLAVLALAAGAALAPYVLALILAFVINPAVDWLEERGVRRGLGTVLIIGGIVAAVAAVAYLVVDRLIEQASALLATWPEVSATLVADLRASDLPTGIVEPLVAFIDDLPDLIVSIAPDLLGTVVATIGSGIVALVTLAGLPFFLYYVLVDRTGLIRGAYSLIPEEYVDSARDIAGIANGVFAAWAWSQLLLALSVSVPVFIGFLLFGIIVDPFFTNFALLFAAIAFFTEFIPIVGAYLAMIPAVVITLAAVGPLGAVLTAALFMAVQLFEGSVLVPRIQGRALSLPPAVVLVALVVGVALGGFLGVLIALPVTATLLAVIAYLYDRAAAPLPEPVGAEEVVAYQEPD